MSNLTTSTAPKAGRLSWLSGAIVRRVVWNLVPVVLVIGALEVVLVGEDGLFVRHQLKKRLYASQMLRKQVRADNAVLASRVRSLRENPAAVRRAAANRLLAAEVGSTIYRFPASDSLN
jgi:cell division protein FtsB